MANRNMALDVIVRLRDLLSGPLRGLRGALEGVSNMARKIGVVGTAIAGISFLAPMQEAAAFQQQLLDIAGTSNLTGQAAFGYVDKAKEQFEGLALQYGQFSDTIAKGASKMIAAGIDEGLVDSSMATIAKATKAANASMDDMSGVAISLLQTLKLPASELEDTLAALAVAGKLGSFEFKDMARFFPNLTGQMAKLGITGRDAANQLASMLEIARKGTADPAEAANNLQNFLAKITSPETAKNFRKMGVDILGVMKDATTKGISPIEAVVQKITKLTGVSGKEIEGLMKKAKANGMTETEALEDVRQKLVAIHGAGALGGLFSDMQVMNFLIPMLANIDEYKRIKEEVAKATGAMTDADFATQMQGLNTQLTIFRELGTQASREVGLAFGTWMPMINGYLTDAIKWLRDLDKETGGMVRQALAWAGAGVLAAAALGALGLILPVIGAGLSLLVSPLAATASGALLIGRYFLTAGRSAIALQAALAAMSGVQFSGFARLAVGLRGMLMAIPGVSALGSVLAGVGSVIAGITAPAWAFVAAIAAAGIAVYKYWEPISNFMVGFGAVVGSAIADAWAAFSSFAARVAAWHGQKILDIAEWLGLDPAVISAKIESVAGFFSVLPARIADIFSGIGDIISSLFTQTDYSDEAEASFRSAGERAGQAMVDAIKGMFSGLLDWFGGLGGMIIGAIGKIDLTSLIRWPEPPSWLPQWLGGGGPPTPPATGTGGLLPANRNGAPAVLPAESGTPAPQQLNVQTQATVKVEGPGQVVGQQTAVTSSSPNVNTGRAVGRP